MQWSAAEQSQMRAAMERDGWWATPPTETNRTLRRRVLRELLYARWPWFMGSINSPRSR